MIFLRSLQLSNWPHPKHLLHGERYYLEDGTVSMSEPRIENCGIVQGSHGFDVACGQEIGERKMWNCSKYTTILRLCELTQSWPWLSCSFVSYWFLCSAWAHTLVESPGSFLKRQRIPRDDGRGCIGPEDLRCGIEICLFGRTKQTRNRCNKIKTVNILTLTIKDSRSCRCFSLIML